MLVTGARQVGKTTFLRELGDQDRSYVSLDDPRVLELARTDPALFMQRYTGPVIIDEIQYAPGLLPYIKMAVDADGIARPFLVYRIPAVPSDEGSFRVLGGTRGDHENAWGCRVGSVTGRGRRLAEPFMPTPRGSVIAPEVDDATNP